MIKRAIRICFNAHCDQHDKGNMPYVFHPYHIAEQMDTENEIITALLHDVVEDSSYTISDLIAEDFDPEIIEALELLTYKGSKTDTDEYEKYIRKIKKNPLARKVKLEDLRHNADITRIKNPIEKDYIRTEQYKEMIKILEGDD